jgi:hypothetical protein
MRCSLVLLGLLLAGCGSSGDGGGGGSVFVPDPTDLVGPLVTLAPMSGSITAGGSIIVQVQADETMVGLQLADFQITGGTPVSLTGSGLLRSLTITAGPSVGTLSVVLPAGACADVSGNPCSSASTAITITAGGGGGGGGGDIVRPTLTLLPGAASAAPGEVVQIGVVASEPVIGLSAADFVVVNGATMLLTGNGSVFVLNIQAGAVTGPLTIQVPAGACADQAGNPNLPATAAISVDPAIEPKAIAAR